MSDFPKQLLENISGFPDQGPAEAILQEKMLAVIRARFARAGYSPLETPLVERPEVLTAKADGEITTQMYGLRLLNPAEGANDEKNLALRYDHTIPLARYVATHSRDIPFPYRRYAIGPIFRGERPKDGRERQFIQADIDAIGDGELALGHDAEMVAVVSDIFSSLMIGSFTIRINNRKVLAALLRGSGASDEQVPALMRAIDRLEKVGEDKTRDALVELGLAEASAQELLDSMSAQRSPAETMEYLGSAQLDAEGEAGIAELREVLEAIRALEVPSENYTVDLSIARGLDYYTGTVYETVLNDHPDLGSIASGGRYEDLAGAFTNQKFPGVGISIGVTRLLSRLIKAGLVRSGVTTMAPVLVTSAEQSSMPTYFKYAAELRSAGIACELYLADKSLDKQLHFADRKGFAFAVIAKQENLDTDTAIIRNLATGDQQEVASADLAATLRDLIG